MVRGLEGVKRRVGEEENGEGKRERRGRCRTRQTSGKGDGVGDARRKSREREGGEREKMGLGKILTLNGFSPSLFFCRGSRFPLSHGQHGTRERRERVSRWSSKKKLTMRWSQHGQNTDRGGIWRFVCSAVSKLELVGCRHCRCTVRARRAHRSCGEDREERTK